jgi:C4-dicarboxylate-specific signal transduction histidine kinase
MLEGISERSLAVELRDEVSRLEAKVTALEARARASDARRRAMIHIMSDLAEGNRKLNDQRKAMLHILVDYEKDRADLASQTESLNNSRRALMHILQDAHQTNLRLGRSRKAMIHIMGDLRRTTEEISNREQELREKQAQLVQAAKLATLGELTTGVAHELNNPLNNIALYVGNVIDVLSDERNDKTRVLHDLNRVMEQVNKATGIINHLRTFGRAAEKTQEPVLVNGVIERSLSLLSEQLRLRQIGSKLSLSDEEPLVAGNPIQLEQVFMNLVTNAVDALEATPTKEIRISTTVEKETVRIIIEDTGPGVPEGLKQRIFDPFFTTKDVGQGTGLGLSIVYGIVKDHGGSIAVEDSVDGGARFIIHLLRTE